MFEQLLHSMGIQIHSMGIEDEDNEGNGFDPSSKWYNKEDVVRTHELLRAHLAKNHALAKAKRLHYTKLTVAGEAVRPSVPLGRLRPILIRDLQVGCHHKDRVLYGTLSVEPFEIVSVQTVIVDEEGHAAKLSVYNALPHQKKAQKMATLFQKSLKVAIKEPYLKIAQDGSIMIRVDNPADFVRNPEVTEGSVGGNMSASTSSSLPLSDQPRALLDARALRNQGNEAFVAQEWKQAIQLYTDALKVLLQYKSVPLWLPSSSTALELDKELMLGFSNRAEARLRLKHFEAAESDARKALQLEKNNVKSLSRRGRALHGLHQYKEAALCYKKALQMAGDEYGKSTKELTSALNASEVCERQARTGKYDLLKMWREEEKGGEPMCGEYIGPVEIGPASERSLGRGLLLTKDVEPGDLLLVGKAVAYAKVDRSLMMGMSQQEISFASTGSKLSPVCKIYHEDLATQVVERAQTSKRFFEQMKTLSAAYASDIENSIPAIDLFLPKPISTELDKVFTVEDEEALSPGSIDEKIIRNAIKCNALEIPGEMRATLWLLPSFINHSCLPNACWVRVGKETILVRAIRSLKKGEEVTIFYYDNPAISLIPRASFLQRCREFECRCERCCLEMTMKPFLRGLELNAVLPDLMVDSAVEVVQSLEWAFQNMKMFDDEKQQQWLRTSYALSYVLCLDKQQTLENIPPLATLLKSLLETLGGSELILNLVRQRADLAQCDPHVTGILAQMYLCLYGKQAPATLGMLVALRHSMVEKQLAAEF